MCIQVLLSYGQFCNFSLNKSCKTFLEPVLPPVIKNWQLVYPNWNCCTVLSQKMDVSWKWIKNDIFQLRQLKLTLMLQDNLLRDTESLLYFTIYTFLRSKEAITIFNLFVSCLPCWMTRAFSTNGTIWKIIWMILPQ